jgi:hypothetical protein
MSRIACGRNGERSTTTSRPINESAMRRSTLRMTLPSKTIEFSISQSEISQLGPIAVNGPT